MEFLKSVVATAIALAATIVSASDYPKRPIRYMVASPPGTVIDIAARAMAQQMSARLGQPVVVDNKPGAGGLIAANAALAAAPDGYTILGSSSALISQPSLTKGFNFDLSKDVTAVTTFAEGRTAAVVRSDSTVRSIEDLVALMKAKPGKINIGVGASIDILQVSLFRKATGTEFEMVRYPGGTAATTALVAGDIDAVLGAGIPLAKPQVDGGKLRFVSVNGTKRDPLILETPALSESTLPQLQKLSHSALYGPFWMGIAVSSKVPKDIVNALYGAVRDGAKAPEMAQRFQANGLTLTDLPPPERATLDMISGAAELSHAVKEAGIEPQ